jgi:hypothetical protein
MAARARLVLLLLLFIVGTTFWSLRATRTFTSPEELLANWQRAADSAQSVQGSVHLWRNDPVWGDKEFKGEFWYTADQRGAYMVRPLPPQHPDDWTYLEWDATQVKFVDNHAKTISILKVPLAMRTQSLLLVRKVIMPQSWLSEGLSRWARMMSLPSEHLPLILPREGKFWADEFHWKPVPGLANWLTAEPLEADEKYKERIDLILDPRTSLPLAVQKHELGPARTRVVTVVSNLQLNAASLPTLAREIDETSPKWKITRESVPQTTQAK